ncbi:g4955 [Coccomyxa elongata]
MGFESVVMTAILVLESIALLLMLAGVGALQDKCDEIDRELVNADLSCHATYRYQWWLVIFNAAVQIGVVFAMINGTVVKYRIAVCSLLAVLTVVLMDNANEFLTLHNVTTGTLADRAAVFTAGCVLAAMMHLALIVAFGRDMMPSHVAEQPTGAYKTYENQMADCQGQQNHQSAVAPPLSYPPV